MTSSSLSRSKVPQHLFFHIRSKSHSKLLTIFEYHVPSSVFLVMETDQDQDGPLFTFGEMKKNNTSQTHVQSGNVYAFLAFATKRGWNIRSFEKTGRFLIRTISNFYRNPVPTSTALSQPCLSEEKYDLTKNQTLVLEKKDHPFSYVDITQGFVEIQIQPLSFAAFLERETPFLTKTHPSWTPKQRWNWLCRRWSQHEQKRSSLQTFFPGEQCFIPQYSLVQITSKRKQARVSIKSQITI